MSGPPPSWPPLPPVDARHRPSSLATATDDALVLVHDHAGAVVALGPRSSADFRLLPTLAHDRAALLVDALAEQDAPRPTLLAELAPVLAPRMERLRDHLKRRLARTRRMTPLGRIRQLDTACLRHAARRPGRDLIDKAGPRQELLAVQRVPRFDTMENRLLLHVARRVRATTYRERRALTDRARQHPRARLLRRMEGAARTLAEHPDLQGIGRPRPGERPSNALLGDKDYRAVWRAQQLLVTEDERFRENWLHLGTLWQELLLLAMWADMDANGSWTPLPAVAHIHERIAPGHSSRALLPSRSWVHEHPHGRVVLTIRHIEDLVLLVRKEQSSTGSRRSCHHVPARLHAGERLQTVFGPPSAGSARDAARQSLARVGVTLPTPREREEQARPEFVALCAMDRRLGVATTTACVLADPVAVAVLPIEDEQPLMAFGSPATHATDFLGPAQLHQEQPEWLGELLHGWRGRRDTAVVVPNDANELVLQRLRRGLGPSWAVWSVVAAALAAAHHAPVAFPCRTTHRTVLVVVHTTAGLDIAVLEERWEAEPGHAPERVWIRSTPQANANRNVLPTPKAALGAYLRATNTHSAWWHDGATLHAAPEPIPPTVVEQVESHLERWKGEAPSAAILAGVASSDLPASLASLPCTELAAEDLTQGALTFLTRHHAGLPTWKDRLPHVVLQAAGASGNAPVDIIPKGVVVSPGEAISHTSEQSVIIRHGQASVRFPFTIDQAPAPYQLLVSGPPLPLSAPTRVQVQVNYRHGREGLQGVLVASDPHSKLRRLPFTLDNGQTEDSHSPLPALPEPELTEATLKELERLADQLISRFAAPSRRKRKGAAPANALSSLPELLKSFPRIRASGPGAMNEAARKRLTQIAAPLDWLLGVRGDFRVRGHKRPPKLDGKTTQAVLRARSWLGIRTGLDVRSALAHASDPGSRVRGLGLLVDGQADEVWEELMNQHHDRPEWSQAITYALSRHPGLLASLQQDVAIRLLKHLVTHMEEEAARKNPRRGTLLYGATATTYLCLVRNHEHLPPEHPACEDAALRLSELRAILPKAVLAHRGRLGLQDGQEPLGTAISFLRGQYAPLPSLTEA